MRSIDDILAQMRGKPRDVRFGDLCILCDHYFGESRRATTHERIYRVPWLDDPQVNLQNRRGKARAYQVRQVLKAIARLESEHAVER